MKWPRLQEADFSQYEKQIEVVVKGRGIKCLNEITVEIMVMHIHVDQMYNFEGLGVPLNCAFKWLHNTVIAM